MRINIILSYPYRHPGSSTSERRNRLLTALAIAERCSAIRDRGILTSRSRRQLYGGDGGILFSFSFNNGMVALGYGKVLLCQFKPGSCHS